MYSTAGLMVEFHLAKVGVRVRFPGGALVFLFSLFKGKTINLYTKVLRTGENAFKFIVLNIHSLNSLPITQGDFFQGNHIW